MGFGPVFVAYSQHLEMLLDFGGDTRPTASPLTTQRNMLTGSTWLMTRPPTLTKMVWRTYQQSLLVARSLLARFRTKALSYLATGIGIMGSKSRRIILRSFWQLLVAIIFGQKMCGVQNGDTSTKHWLRILSMNMKMT